MLKAIGFTDEDLKKPIIGVANTWTETMNCNYKLRDLAVHVKRASAPPAARPWNSTPSPSATASPWAPKA
jgi:dihydroxy-acid dehydratase